MMNVLKKLYFMDFISPDFTSDMPIVAPYIEWCEIWVLKLKNLRSLCEIANHVYYTRTEAVTLERFLLSRPFICTGADFSVCQFFIQRMVPSLLGFPNH